MYFFKNAPAQVSKRGYYESALTCFRQAGEVEMEKRARAHLSWVAAIEERNKSGPKKKSTIQAFLQSAEHSLDAKMGDYAAKSLGNADKDEDAVAIFITLDDRASLYNAAMCYKKLNKWIDAATFFWRARYADEAVKVLRQNKLYEDALEFIHGKIEKEKLAVLNNQLKDSQGQKGSEEKQADLRAQIVTKENTVAAMEKGGRFSGVVTELVRSAVSEYFLGGKKGSKGKGSLLAVLSYLPVEQQVLMYDAERSRNEGTQGTVTKEQAASYLTDIVALLTREGANSNLMAAATHAQMHGEYLLSAVCFDQMPEDQKNPLGQAECYLKFVQDALKPVVDDEAMGGAEETKGGGVSGEASAGRGAFPVALPAVTMTPGEWITDEASGQDGVLVAKREARDTTFWTMRLHNGQTREAKEQKLVPLRSERGLELLLRRAKTCLDTVKLEVGDEGDEASAQRRSTVEHLQLQVKQCRAQVRQDREGLGNAILELCNLENKVPFGCHRRCHHRIATEPPP